MLYNLNIGGKTLKCDHLKVWPPENPAQSFLPIYDHLYYLYQRYVSTNSTLLILKTQKTYKKVQVVVESTFILNPNPTHTTLS